MMSFFLLGHGETDEVQLLAPTLFETRQDALAELTRLTSDASFTSWDSEVFVVDYATAIPVLLVRPASSEINEVEPAPEPIGGVYATQLVDVTEFEAASDAVGPEVLGESAAAFEAPAEPLVEPVGDAAIADAIEESAAPVVGPEVAEPASADSLREALLRTTVHMESAGIVAPESVGPPAASEEPEVAPAGVAASTEFPEVSPADLGVEPEAPAWPWDVSAPVEEPVAGAAVAPAEVPHESSEALEAAQPAEPFVLHALEEPATDDADILPGLAQEGAFEVSRPVILGAYDEPAMEVPAEPAPEVAPEARVAAEAEPPAAVEETVEPMSALEPSAPAATTASGVEPAAAQEASPEAISDFIFDLEDVTTVPEAEGLPAEQTAPVAEQEAVTPPPELEPAGLSAEPEPDYTCDDCVYVETCPNKGQRLPKDCVSFQWK